MGVGFQYLNKNDKNLFIENFYLLTSDVKMGITFKRYMDYAHEDINCELLDGVLIIHSPASLNHELIFKFMLTLLDLYTQEKDLGLVVVSRFTMRLSSKWAPEPDIMYIASNIKETLKETYLDGPATVVFEILSPSTRQDDLQKKLPKYLESGVKEVWIVDPSNKNVRLYWKKQDFETYEKQDWVVSRVIPGFCLKAEWLWQAKSLSVIEKFKVLKNNLDK